MNGRRTESLLRRVAARRRLVDIAAKAYVWLLVLTAAFAALLLASRLAAVIPDWFHPLAVLALPAAALLCGVASSRGTSRLGAARRVDIGADTDDLFMTACLVEQSAVTGTARAVKSVGEYGPLVLRDAEERAASIDTSRVVPFRWQSRTRNAALALALPLMGILFLPQLDPFGKEEERKLDEERRKRLGESRKAVELRKAILKKEGAGPEARETKRLIAELKDMFNRMKPKAKTVNLRRMQPIQKALGQLWRKTNEKRLADALKQNPMAQRFGGAAGKTLSDWKKELLEGKSAAISKELEELGKLAEKLSKTSDPAAAEKLRRQLRQRLQRLSDFAQGDADSQALENALTRAIEQLEMSGIRGLSREALKALQESLYLTEQEIAALAQSIQDLKALEGALKAMQLAKALNELEGLDGKACAGCKGMADYAALYERLLAQACAAGTGMVLGQGKGSGGKGPGMGGPGQGRGGKAPEDETASTGFKSELSRSALSAGKMLLQWKTRGLSDPGKAKEEFLESVQQVKQGASEAVLRQQVPPGCREAVRDYFDTVEKVFDESDE